MGKTLNTGKLTNAIAQDSSNNIGIGGAASGSYKLQVSGTTNLTGALTGTSATFSGTLETTTIQSFNASPIYLFSTATTSNYEVLAIDKTATDARIRVYKSGTGSYRDLVFETGGTTALRLASNGAATFSSSVTATSESSLFKEGFIVKATTTGGGGSQPAYTYYTAAGSKRWSSFLNVGDDKFHIANASNSEVFTITQGGNVGIGTSSPANKLQVNSTSGDGMFLTSYLTTTGAADTGAILGFGIYDGVNNRDAAIIKGLKENGTSGNYSAYLSFSTRPNGGSVTERMRITSDGAIYSNYGSSGTSARTDITPNLILEGKSGVAGGRAGMSVLANGTGSSLIMFGASSTSNTDGFISYVNASRSMDFGTADGTRMTITSGGNVGIGTDSPTSIAGYTALTINNTSSGSFIDLNNSGTNNSRWLSLPGGDVRLYSSSNLSFYTNGISRATISSGGYISLNNIVYGNTVNTSPRTLYIESGTGSLGGISSIRASKKNIQNIENVDWIYELNPVTFNYRKKDEDGNYTEESHDELFYGLIAEDTEPIADFLVNYNDKEDGSKEMAGIEYMRLITPMLKAIQEQNEIITKQGQAIEELKALIAAK